MKKFLPIILLTLIVFSFFNQFLLQKKLPIPADTIIGLYHPFRDLYSKNYPNGIPYKNFLITDPVRQQYPWKKLAIVQDQRQLPIWNPYSLSGTPLLANSQSAFFYPLNFLLIIFPFDFGWSLLILLQPILAGIFMYLYLSNLKLNRFASFLGSLAFTFSGFSTAWLEWGTVVHTALWLPLILLSIDKIYDLFNKNQFSIFPWSFIFLFSLTSSFFAGHLQIFFYLALFSAVYILARLLQSQKRFKIILLFAICYLLFAIVTFIQWFPTLQFILLSARDIHITQWQNPGWFIPWQHLIQFIAPDFFGNPATLNYWGTWNYAEMVGYIGIFPMIMSFYALFFRKDKKVLFFGAAFFLSLIFALPTIFAKIPFILKIPFISSSQPTRLLFIADFSLAALAALGFDFYLKNKKNIFYPVIFLILIFTCLWIFVLFGKKLNIVLINDLLVAKQNLILPTTILSSVVFILLSLKLTKSSKLILVLYCIIVGITAFDLLRFAWKFTPFTNASYLFPKTQALKFLEDNIGNFRIMSSDLRILPPNFSVVYKIQSIDGYDPLYLKSYGELMSASENGNILEDKGFGFDRIIAPQNYESKIIDLLGVKYVLSLTNLSSPKLKKVFQEGQTRIYENKNVVPRAFFVKNVKVVSKKDQLKKMISNNFDPSSTAFIGESIKQKLLSEGAAEIVNYKENSIIINTENKSEGFLVLSDSYYPAWKATIDGKETKIYLTDFNLRGIFVPGGKHTILFYDKLF